MPDSLLFPFVEELQKKNITENVPFHFMIKRSGKKGFVVKIMKKEEFFSLLELFKETKVDELKKFFKNKFGIIITNKELFPPVKKEEKT